MTRTLLLFDLGGVLADLGDPPASMGLDMGNDEFWSIWLASKSVQAFEKGELSEDDFLSHFCSEIGLDEPAIQFRHRLLRWHLRLYPGACAAVERLRDVYDIALLSNTNAIHWNMVRNQDNFQALFDRLFLSFETGLTKPGREAFEHVLANVAQEPGDIRFLDDSEKNIAAARAMGIGATRVDGRAGLQSMLRAAGVGWPKDQAGR
jgi:HAD superfamily hydrolase (TIGR01509 family)